MTSNPRIDPFRIRVCSRGPRYETYDNAVLPDDRLSYRDDNTITCIAMHDPSRRRGLWFRVIRGDAGEPVAVRLYAGREGDDCDVVLAVGYPIDSRKLREVLDVLSVARWGYSLAFPRHDDGDNSCAESRLCPHEGGWCAEDEARCECAPRRGWMQPVGDRCAYDLAHNCFREVPS